MHPAHKKTRLHVICFIVARNRPTKNNLPANESSNFKQNHSLSNLERVNIRFYGYGFHEDIVGEKEDFVNL
jgi:hypothetical protein